MSSNMQSDELSSNRSDVHKGKNIVHESDMADLCNSDREIVIGQLYETKEDLKKMLGIDAIKNNYEFKVKRSSKERFEVGCVGDECKWKLCASKLQQSSYFKVRKYVTMHSCSLDVINRHHRQVSSSLIGQCIKSKYEGVSRVHRPRDIIEDMLKDMGVSISYVKAWRAKEHAMELVRGSSEESYALLPSYFAVLEAKNPGTITHIETDENNCFLYCFMSLGPCIRGFRSAIRPVIAVDGTFLKGKYLGTLFVATCMDGNKQIYPLAFGVGDSENDASWNWFLTKLRGAIGEVDDLVFISDRHESIRKALSTIFPNAHHGACIFHISQNIRHNFKHERAHKLYFTAAKAYRVPEFHRLMTEIYKVDYEVGDYLNSAGYEKWTRAYFDGKRYNIMTTNIAECLNAITKDARKLPIT
nr:PKS-NRPS hybrid synthetase CHGG_01239-like [Malus domestica]